MNELFDFSRLRLGDGLRFLANALQIIRNQAYQKSDERLDCCMVASFRELLPVNETQTGLFSPKAPPFRETNLQPPGTKPIIFEKNTRFARILVEWRNCTRRKRQ